MIRFSTTSPGCYTLSRVGEHKEILHQKIFYDGAIYALANVKGEPLDRVYNSFHDLFAAEGPAMKIRIACEGSKYAEIFDPDQIRPRYV